MNPSEKPVEPYSPEQLKALSRAASSGSLWSAGIFEISVTENTLSLAELDVLVTEIQPEFAVVSIRRVVAGPQATGLLEAALLVTLTVTLHGFLQELGKDLYVGFRNQLKKVYRNVRVWANDRRYRPLLFRINTHPGLVFEFEEGLDDATFEAALRACLSFSEVVTLDPSHEFTILEFDRDSLSWRLTDKHW